MARLLINRQFALLWSGQSISYLGDYVFDTTLLHGFHATLLHMQFRALDTLLLGVGALAVLGGLYAMVNLRQLSPATQSIEQPAAPAETVTVASSD